MKDRKYSLLATISAVLAVCAMTFFLKCHVRADSLESLEFRYTPSNKLSPSQLAVRAKANSYRSEGDVYFPVSLVLALAGIVFVFVSYRSDGPPLPWLAILLLVFYLMTLVLGAT